MSDIRLSVIEAPGPGQVSLEITEGSVLHGHGNTNIFCGGCGYQFTDHAADTLVIRLLDPQSVIRCGRCKAYNERPL